MNKLAESAIGLGFSLAVVGGTFYADEVLNDQRQAAMQTCYSRPSEAAIKACTVDVAENRESQSTVPPVIEFLGAVGAAGFIYRGWQAAGEKRA